VNSRSVTLVFGMLLSAVGTRDLAAQCRVSSDTASLYVNRLRIAYANMDTSYVKSQGEPVAAPSDISLVTSSNTCKSGVSAYNKTHGLTTTSGINSAYVIALGRKGYVVINPSQTSGEYTMMFIYDSKWVFKKAVGG
jgi:hypothetical protein